VRVVGRDGYGRTLARVLLDGQSVSAWLVAQGHAYSHRNRWDQGPLVTQEEAARALRRGVHGQGGAMRPKDFRRSHGPCVRAGGAAVSAAR
jgi:micrococcal nuclease